jgi:hypothetical protein
LITAFAWIAWRMLAGPARCWTCKHFDYDIGQGALRSHGPFWAAAQHLGPAQMGREHGGLVGGRARWADFGACCHPKQTDAEGAASLTCGRDVCESHGLVSPRTLLRRMREEEDARKSPV